MQFSLPRIVQGLFLAFSLTFHFFHCLTAVCLLFSIKTNVEIRAITIQMLTYLAGVIQEN